MPTKPIFIQRDRLNEFLEEFMTQSHNDVELKSFIKFKSKNRTLYHDIITARKTFLNKNKIKNKVSFNNWLKDTKDSLQENTPPTCIAKESTAPTILRSPQNTILMLLWSMEGSF